MQYSFSALPQSDCVTQLLHLSPDNECHKTCDEKGTVYVAM